MRGFLSAIFLLLVLVICSIEVDAYKCRCIRKRPKLSYKDVQKVEMKARYPFCKVKMVYITTGRYGGKQYCLHPKLTSTTKLLDQFTKWRLPSEE
ncbi:C-X-C motif chemokine 14 [Amblyraja radiata]|uniref:C-X-C motif chemokine 14 n=1 Tax=Amblyraja radiata TaxID=386614 RepID=UPI0014029EA3|nr:C-X-C motif chemokine 14 [Amblyraja radiata]